MDILGAAVKAAETILGRRGEEKKRVADYLDELAADADALAKFWQEALIAFEAGYDDANDDANFEKRTGLAPFAFGRAAQTYYFSRLEAFYREFTTAVGDKMPREFSDGVIFRLGALMQFRNAARSEVEAALRSAWPRLLSIPERRARFDRLTEAVEALQREAGMLQTAAKTYRASGR